MRTAQHGFGYAPLNVGSQAHYPMLTHLGVDNAQLTLTKSGESGHKKCKVRLASQVCHQVPIPLSFDFKEVLLGDLFILCAEKSQELVEDILIVRISAPRGGHVKVREITKASNWDVSVLEMMELKQPPFTDKDNFTLWQEGGGTP
ncbi:unnamed protein product [Prunus armeniaca]